MANEPAQGAGRTSSGSAGLAGSGLAGVRTAGVRPCPSCSTVISVHATICPNCGENVAIKERSVRCRRCHGRASSNLTVCPHCGRDLQPATTRWLTWGVPLLVVLLLAGLLFVRLSRGNLAQWAQTQGNRLGTLAESLTSRIQPELSVVMIPPSQDADDPLVSQSILASDQTGAGTTVSSPPDAVPVAPPPSGTAVETTTVPVEGSAVTTPEPTDATVAAEPTAAESATEAATEIATATGAATPTAPATAVATATISATPAAGTATTTLQPAGSVLTGTVADMVAGAATQVAARTATAVATTTAAQAATADDTADSLLNLLTPTLITEGPAVLEVYTVTRGDTLFDIATEYDVSLDDLLAFNNLTEDDVFTIQPGDELNIPAPTPVGGPTATPGPTPATYTIRAGDTISEIADELNISTEELMEANGLTLNDVRTLQPGDVLLLPGSELATPTPIATPTAAATTTPTAVAATPTLTPSPAATATAASAMRVDAPRLRTPVNNAALSCQEQNTLNWLAVANVRPTDVYLVHLGYVNKIAADGEEEVIWVITQQQPASNTYWQLDNDFCGLAPVTQGRQWRWYVEVAEKTTSGLQPVSPASATWGFSWQ